MTALQRLLSATMARRLKPRIVCIKHRFGKLDQDYAVFDARITRCCTANDRAVVQAFSSYLAARTEQCCGW